MGRIALTGKLEKGSLADILGFLSGATKTGLLMVGLGPGLGFSLRLRAGRISALSGPLAPRLEDALVRLGIPKERIVELLAQKSAGKKLEELAPAFPELRAVQERRALVALSYALASPGEFRFREEDPIPPPPWGVSASEILLEALRRLDENPTPLSPLEVYGIPQSLGAGVQAIRELLPQDWLVLSVLDGERPLAQVGAFLVLPWDELSGRVERLLSLGLVEASRERRASSGERLRPGDPAPNFTLPALDGTLFSLGSLLGKKVLLSFFRHGGCPVCALRVHELIRAYPGLKALGVEVVGVFASSLETLKAGTLRLLPPFPILADPDGAVHTRYGVERSLLGALDPRALPSLFRGLRLGVKPQGDGDSLRMPADFLVDRGLVLARAHYGRHPADHIPLKQVVAWAQDV